MKIKTLTLGELGVNCYLVEGKNGVAVIDPGYKSQEAIDFLNNNSDKDRLIILTHNHFDHIGFADELSRLTDTKIAIGEYDNDGLGNPQINLSFFVSEPINPPKADILLKDGDELRVGDLSFKIMHTSGHTVGGICLIIENCIFSGDTLFFESIGRTDFPGGNIKEIENSILSIYSLGDNFTVYPGHGIYTTVAHEKQFNPYVSMSKLK